MSVTHTPKVNSRVSSNYRALEIPNWKKISGVDKSTRQNENEQKLSQLWKGGLEHISYLTLICNVVE